MRIRSLVQVARAGSLWERVRAVRDGEAAIRVAMVAAALETGVLDALRRPRTTAQLAKELGAVDEPLLEAFLGGLRAARLVRSPSGGHRLARRGRALLGDDVVRAAYEAFGGFHTGLYRDLPKQLRGGPGRRDVATRGEVIARLSRAMEPLVHAALAGEVRAAAPGRILDVGCGDGAHLAHMLTLAPAAAAGIGIDVDDAAAALAARTLSRHGLSGRARVLRADVRDVVAEPALLGGPVDLALLANAIYYLPEAERAALLRDVGALLAPGGTLLVVSTMADGSAFSRHFDLLLRAQEGQMALPTTAEVQAAVAVAGLDPVRTRRLTPGEPLYAVTARRPTSP
ncbi:class I SAM-dependent methyltransferase [Georgenia sp. SYP-B2076]|uniref:class I SAM-dependent methyltransferase n=1 Tax=Georgenia sp. SYP-B2076 TaxID=2495881 RepID=UPI000F8EA439|nr:class I SAM-dependent methyltransferase [Georgenia sp. SYP-B2076]